MKAEEESTDWHAAREQQDARTANCGGSAAVAAASDTAVAADAAAIAEQAASSSAVAAHAEVEDTMTALSSALSDPQGVFPYEAFRNFAQLIGSYRQHNAALKYWREELEHRSNPLGHRTLLFPNDTRVRIGTVVWGKGQDWSFDRTTVTWWSWREMVAQLDEKSMQIAVQGVDGRSCGLLSCMVAPRPHSYDHKRHKKLSDDGETVVAHVPACVGLRHQAAGRRRSAASSAA